MTTCASCQSSLVGRAAFRVRGRSLVRTKCVRCSLIDGALVRRSAAVAAVVGTILVALNQGDALVSGEFPWGSQWPKLPLTYFVPFCVATYSALANGYRPT